MVGLVLSQARLLLWSPLWAMLGFSGNVPIYFVKVVISVDVDMYEASWEVTVSLQMPYFL